MLELPTVTVIQFAAADDDAAFRARDRCETECRFADSLVLPALESYRAYNEFIIKQLNACFNTPHVLLYQSDGFVLDTTKWGDDFLQYDYIGAPMWNGYVGNGGFSLRSKRFCEATATLDLSVRNDKVRKWLAIDPDDYHNEDLFLCVERRADLKAMGLTFAPIAVAEQFSWELSERYPEYLGSFGFHGKHTMEYLKQKGILTDV